MFYSRWITYPNMEDAYGIRVKVFVEEQKVPKELEIDDLDPTADHIVLYEDGIPVATGRLVQENGTFLIGRIAVLKEHRGKRYGEVIVRMLIRKAFDKGAQEVHVHAQIQAKEFYRKLDFEPVGDVFLEAGIEHIEMIRKSDVGGCCSSGR